MGTKPFAASPHSLRHSCGRNIVRPPSLDPPSVALFRAREDPQPRLSWEFSGRSQSPLARQKTILRRSRCGSGGLHAVLEIDSPSAPPRLGGLCQARLRWPPTGVALSGSLHPSGGHFQSSLAGLRSEEHTSELQSQSNLVC